MGKTSFDHEISNLRAAPGELSFDARIGERTTGVWMRTDSPLTPNADAALAAAAMPAMRHGGRLRMTDPVSPRMLRGQREFQAIQRAWSLDWPFTEPLHEVEVEAPVREPAAIAPKGRAAAFFSGGIDSWGIVLENPDLTDLIFVRGFDLTHADPHAALAGEVEARLREAAEDLGLSLHVVTTNLRELSDPELPWDVFYGCAAAAVGLFLAPLFDRVLIAGDSDYAVQVSFGANRLVDQLWSTEELELVDAGGRFDPDGEAGTAGREPVRLPQPPGLLGGPRPHLQLRPLPQVPGDAGRAGGDRGAGAGHLLPAGDGARPGDAGGDRTSATSSR